MTSQARLERNLGHLVNAVSRIPSFIRTHVGIRKAPEWICVAEPAGWSISEDAKFVSGQMHAYRIGSVIVSRPDLIAGHILHYCSLHTYSLRRRAWAAGRNKHVVTCFHGDFGLDPEMDRMLNQILVDKVCLSALIVSCSIMRQRFISWGMPEEKIHLIPLPVDGSVFRPNPELREKVRREAGIPPGTIVIGSFQKDGIGHTDGLAPKMIKGPDIFCDVVERLSHRYPIMVFLTGPARGYVKQRLDSAGVRYVHQFAGDLATVAGYYAALDIYLMASREEGGPKSLLESLASGIPFIGTEVGMVGDLLKSGENGWVCPIDDTDALVEACEKVILRGDVTEVVRRRGLEIVKNYAPDVIGKRYVDIYRKFAIGSN